MRYFTNEYGCTGILPDNDDIVIQASATADLIDGKALHDLWQHIVAATHPDYSQLSNFQVNPQIFLPLDDKKFMYVRLRSVSALEKWGPNSNGDGFPASELIRSFATLIGKGFYEEHNSFNPQNAIGVNVHAEWVADQMFVESVAAIDKIRFPRKADMWRDLLSSRRAGVSIGCIAGEAQCSVCGNIARKAHQLCFVADTPITMASGKIAPIATVKVGDYVVDADGNYNRVTQTFVREVVGEHMVDLKIRSKQHRIIGTCNHPFLTMKRVQLGPTSSQTIALPPHFHDMGGLKKGDLTFSPIIQGEVGGLGSDQLRWLGWYASEGHVEGESSNGGQPYVVGFSLGNEEDFAEEISRLSERLFNRTPRAYRYQGNRISLRMSCKTATDFALKHCGRGAKTKVLSDEIMRAPVEWQKEFLAAYILGDGTVGHSKLGKNRGITKGIISIATASKQMSQQLCWMAERCGIGARNYRVRNQPGPVQRSRGQTGEFVLYHVYLSLSDTSRIADQLRNYFDVAEDTRVTASQGRIPYEQGWVSPIDDVRHTKYSGKVYNFEVDKSHTYMVDGVAVHNCGHMNRLHPQFVKGRRIRKQGNQDDHLAHDICRNIYFYEQSGTKLPADRDAMPQVIMGSRRFAVDEPAPSVETEGKPSKGVVSIGSPLPTPEVVEQWADKATHDALITRFKKLVKDEVYKALEPEIRELQGDLRPVVQEIVKEKKSEIQVSSEPQSQKGGGEK